MALPKENAWLAYALTHIHTANKTDKQNKDPLFHLLCTSQSLEKQKTIPEWVLQQEELRWLLKTILSSEKEQEDQAQLCSDHDLSRLRRQSQGTPSIKMQWAMWIHKKDIFYIKSKMTF